MKTFNDHFCASNWPIAFIPLAFASFPKPNNLRTSTLFATLACNHVKVTKITMLHLLTKLYALLHLYSVEICFKAVEVEVKYVWFAWIKKTINFTSFLLRWHYAHFNILRTQLQLFKLSISSSGWPWKLL